MSDKQSSDPRELVCMALRDLLTEVVSTGAVTAAVLQRFREQVPVSSAAFGIYPDVQRYMGEIEEKAVELAKEPPPPRAGELRKWISSHNPAMRDYLNGFCPRDPTVTQNEESTP